LWRAPTLQSMQKRRRLPRAAILREMPMFGMDARPIGDKRPAFKWLSARMTKREIP
jgi:hypothetical protein